MEEVAIHAVGFGGGGFNVDVVLRTIVDHFSTAIEIPVILTPRGDDGYVGFEGEEGELEAYLVVAFTGCAMGDGVGAGFAEHVDVAFSDERACDAGAEEVFTFVDRVGAHGGEDKVFDEFAFEIEDLGVDGSRGECFHAGGLELFALADVGDVGDDFGVVGFLKPFKDDGCIEAAGVGEYDFLDIFAHVFILNMRRMKVGAERDIVRLGVGLRQEAGLGAGGVVLAAVLGDGGGFYDEAEVVDEEGEGSLWPCADEAGRYLAGDSESFGDVVAGDGVIVSFEAEEDAGVLVGSPTEEPSVGTRPFLVLEAAVDVVEVCVWRDEKGDAMAFGAVAVIIVYAVEGEEFIEGTQFFEGVSVCEEGRTDDVARWVCEGEFATEDGVADEFTHFAEELHGLCVDLGIGIPFELNGAHDGAGEFGVGLE